MLKVNFGCGLNKLPGWRNLDSEVDIAKPLPFEDDSVDFILCEHCVEHIAYYAVIDFFAECHRILKPGGTVRISVPSLEQIWKHGTRDYYEFTERWQKIGPTARGAMEAILYAHGHAGGWTATLLEATLYFSGFEAIEQCQPHRSRHAELCDVDGHHKMIGEKFNAIESCIYEATKGMIWLLLRFGISAARICSLNAQIGINAINATVGTNDMNGSLALNAINLLLRCPR